jgi:hypothetical protein
VLAAPQVQALQEIQQERVDEKAMENVMKGKPAAGSTNTAAKPSGKK